MKLAFAIVILFHIYLTGSSFAAGDILIHGRLQDGHNPGWRYMDSDYFGSVQTETLPDNSLAAVLPLALQGRFIFISGNIGPEPEITSDLGLRIEYRFVDTTENIPLQVLVSVEDSAWGPKGKRSDPVPLEQTDSRHTWQTAFLPLHMFGNFKGRRLKRIQIYPVLSGSAKPSGKLLLREISVIKDALFAKTEVNKPKERIEDSPAFPGQRWCAIFPKPFWYTGTDSFYREDLYQTLYEQGFNLIGSPGYSTFSLPDGLQPQIQKLIATAKKVAAFPGMTTYAKMSMCWHFPKGAEERFSKMVWFNGFEQELVCPLDDHYWNERIYPYALGLAGASLQAPLQALMLDWEIYSDTSKTKKIRNVYGVCYCDRCWQKFAAQFNLPVSIPKAERFASLQQHGLRLQYSQAFYARLQELAAELRRRTDQINPKLSFWLLPTVHGDFLTTLARALSSDSAPIFISNEDTYGKASLSIPDEEALQSQARMCQQDMEYLGRLQIPFVYLAAIMGEQQPAYHGKQALTMAKYCHGIWLWELSKVEHYRYGRDQLMHYISIANQQIRQGDFSIPQEWNTVPLLEREQIPEGKIGVGLSGVRAEDLPFPEDWYLYEIKNLSPEALTDTKMLILQNFNVQLTEESPLVQNLRQYVARGGRIFLTHDTGYFMASPWPEIVKGFFIPSEAGDPRHILDTFLKIQTPDATSNDFHCSFNDHLVFEAGSQGKVLAVNKYDYPVVIAGSFGKGKVVFSGCYYRHIDAKSKEAEFTMSLLDWLLK
ncbi:MAG: hypothetical protein WCT05_07000 [Lentisphaeria bacterium]